MADLETRDDGRASQVIGGQGIPPPVPRVSGGSP